MEYKLEDKKKALGVKLQQKVQQFQNADNIRNSLANEITEMRGRLQMLDELIMESNQDEKPSKEISEEK